MVANSTARRLRVRIGDDQQDWSESYGEFNVGYGSVSEDGIVEITGQLDIIYSPVASPESIDVKANPARFRPGQPVLIEVRNDADTAWIEPSFARLIILSEPARPYFGGISLSLGCRLAWAEGAELDGNESGVVLGTAETCDVIASRLLQASEVPAANIALSTWPYSIDYPFGKEGGSFAGRAGQLAWSNDAKILYQNPAGNIVDQPLNFTVGASLASVTLGDTDRDWPPFQGAEVPVETYKTAGLGCSISNATNPDTVVDSVTEDLSVYSGPGGTLGGIGESHRTTVTTSFSLGDPMGTPNPPSTLVNTEVRELEVNIFQNPTVPSQLLLYRETDVAETYESGQTDPTKAKLVSILEEIKQRERSIVPDGVFSNIRDIYAKETTITHGANESVIQLVVEERQAEIILDPLSSNPWNMRVTRVETFTWNEVAPGLWGKKEKIQTARIVDDSRVNRYLTNIWAFKTRTRTLSPSKNNAPPATKFFDAGMYKAETQYEGSSAYAHPGGSTGRNRVDLKIVPFGFSTAQMDLLAQRYRDLAVGRYCGHEGGITINDALLTAPPLPQISVGADNYLADVLSFQFTPDSSSAHCVGIAL